MDGVAQNNLKGKMVQIEEFVKTKKNNKAGNESLISRLICWFIIKNDFFSLFLNDFFTVNDNNALVFFAYSLTAEVEHRVA